MTSLLRHDDSEAMVAAAREGVRREQEEHDRVRRLRALAARLDRLTRGERTTEAAWVAAVTQVLVDLRELRGDAVTARAELEALALPPRGGG